jgi:dTDP-4-amino-4,6-dideoxygalactose transaminase
MQVPFIDLKIQYKNLKSEIDTAIQKVLEKGSFVQGPFLKQFEQEFADYLGVKHVIGVNSGTSALALALFALSQKYKWEKGKWEVILPANTFIATAESIIHAGGKPVLADIYADTFNIDLDKIEKSISKNTKVILPVHLYGQPAEMEKINAIAKKYKLLIVEDAAQAHGAEVKIDDQFVKTGMAGIAASFSFYPSKNLGAYGDGGALATNDEQIAQFLRMYRDHGSEVKYEHSFIGSTDRLDDLQAAVLSVKLKHLDRWNANRKKCANIYSELLCNIDEITIPHCPDSVKPIWHLYVIRLKNRDGLLKYLQENKIGCGLHYKIPLHLQSSLKYLGYQKGDFPVAEKVMSEIISLPMFPELQEEQINFVVQKIKEFLK